jgi:chlorophyllase
MPAQFPPPAVYRAKGDPYRPGPLPVRTVRLAPGHCAAPAPLTIHAPTAPGQYPVVLFQHGFLLHPGCFSSVLTHLASHGFVVVAPQMYAPRGLPLDKPSSVAEAELAEEIVDWMSQHLNQVAGVTARPDCLGVAGHSRGAKVAWWLLKSGHSPIRAVAGVDPVDGAIKLAADPRVLDGSFAATVPALVIGTELGPVLPGPFTSPSAPTGRNHVQFFAACAGPAWHVLLRDHGHLDMLDDLSGTYVRRGMCVGGADREGARRTTAGLLAVFFRGTLQEDAAALRVLSDADAAPLPVEVSAKVPEVRDALRAA